jgi:hypothetical protein
MFGNAMFGGQDFGNMMQSAQNSFAGSIPPINIGYYNATQNNPAQQQQQMDPMQYQQYMLGQFQQQMAPQQQQVDPYEYQRQMQQQYQQQQYQQPAAGPADGPNAVPAVHAAAVPAANQSAAGYAGPARHGHGRATGQPAVAVQEP